MVKRNELSTQALQRVIHYTVNKAIEKATDSARNYVSKKVKTATKPSSKVATKYSTTGSLGKTFKKIPLDQRKSDKYFARNGSIRKTEEGGILTVNSTESLMVGHSTCAPERVLTACFQAVVKELFKQSGIQIDNWAELIEPDLATGNMYISFTYYTNSADPSTITVGSSAIIATDTYQVVGEKLLTAFRTSNTTEDPVSFNSFKLEKRSSGTDDYGILGQVRCKQFFIKMHLTSRLAVQNRTVSSGGVADEAEVDNNPLTGRLYNNTEWYNGFRPKVNNTTYAGTNFICDSTTGFLHTKSDLTTPSVLRKAPPAWYFGVKHATNLVVAPGQIVSSKRDFTIEKIGWNQLMSKFSHHLGGTGEFAVDIGNASLFSLNKLLDAKRGLGVVVSVGYEINQTIRVASHYKTSVLSAPICTVGTTALTTS